MALNLRIVMLRKKKKKTLQISQIRPGVMGKQNNIETDLEPALNIESA